MNTLALVIAMVACYLAGVSTVITISYVVDCIEELKKK